jgi:hypothetical protein
MRLSLSLPVALIAAALARASSVIDLTPDNFEQVSAVMH